MTKTNDKPVNDEVQADDEAAQAEAADEQAEELSELEKLQAALEEAEAQADEYLDGWRRAQAEFSNYKKRQRAERAQIRELANVDLLRKLLPVVDDFERAMATMPEALNLLTWTEGFMMIKRKLEAILRSENVEPIETAGKTFDPRYHEAVTHEVMEGYDEGEIIGEVQTGYVLGDRVLRPALVRVAKAPPAEPEPGEDVSDPEEEGGDEHASDNDDEKEQ